MTRRPAYYTGPGRYQPPPPEEFVQGSPMHIVIAAVTVAAAVFLIVLAMMLSTDPRPPADVTVTHTVTVTPSTYGPPGPTGGPEQHADGG